MRISRLVLLAVAAGGVVVIPAQTARAACHAFTVSAEPVQVAEGGTVTVTVTRDAALNPSQVDVSSVDVTATGGEDYPPQQRTIAFTTETRQAFEIPIIDDTAAEGDESFNMRLSRPGGCPANPNFTVGSDATVTIQRSDAAGEPDPPPNPEPTTAPPATQPPDSPTTSGAATSGAATTALAPAGSEPVPGTEIVSSTSEPTATTLPGAPTPALASDDVGVEEGGSAAGPVVVVVALAALGGAGWLLYRVRRQVGS